MSTNVATIPSTIDTSSADPIYPLQKFLYMLLKSLELQLADDPLTHGQEQVITEHLRHALVTGFEQQELVQLAPLTFRELRMKKSWLMIYSRIFNEEPAAN